MLTGYIAKKPYKSLNPEPEPGDPSKRKKKKQIVAPVGLRRIERKQKRSK